MNLTRRVLYVQFGTYASYSDCFGLDGSKNQEMVLEKFVYLYDINNIVRKLILPVYTGNIDFWAVCFSKENIIRNKL